MRRSLWLVLPLALVLSLSCDSGPLDGELSVELVTASQDLGAIAFTLTAVEPEVIDSVTAACGDCRLDLRRRSATQLDGVVSGPLVPGTLLRLTVSNVNVPVAYRVEVLQVARRDYVVLPVAAVSLEVPLN
jgi:hypothetical protein